MKIGEYIKQKQNKEYKKLIKKREEKLSFSEIEELMGVHTHIYKRGKGGAKKQIR
ncbi:hypothetical protein SAMN05661008_01520 [Alkalithermobacter thermoalcaliphilus JW-YL-7 = DSM 7308]|uniref:Uncharacterized protein n=1 Tax=Alkalithermobacter thermoalcaliphilus JW-YL-7 = DSM 7308 TaxID=1121328 RepID=A0A150FSL4_CLOPD|nr:hypothetical protein JWYL7_1095 [[Clostridium] paradoxum JW-YL-7 = DSM 7308]SHL13352.1 hypothetical protein SAMN05661008_01520 [[Clostridium] paradoxum JW-YL-7 = DSM 7308]